jgi:hypothetical protein
MPKRRVTRKKGKPRGRAGRRPTGLQPGERLIDYKRLTIRLPPTTLVTLHELTERLERTQWRILVEAIEAYAASMKQAKASRRIDV